MTNKNHFMIVDKAGNVIVSDVEDRRRIDFYRKLSQELAGPHSGVRLIVAPIIRYEIFEPGETEDLT